MFKVKFKFNIYIYIPVQTSLPVVHIFSLTIMTYLKMLIGIKSLNAKQFSARLSPPCQIK